MTDIDSAKRHNNNGLDGLKVVSYGSHASVGEEGRLGDIPEMQSLGLSLTPAHDGTEAREG